MQPKYHILIGTVVAAPLLPTFGPLASAGFLVGSLLIDSDHYLDFLVHNRFRSFSIRKMFLYHQHLFSRIRRADFLSLEIFHTIEFLGCMLGLSFLSGSLLLQAVTAGMITHALSDALYLKRIGALSSRAYSFVEYLIRKRRMVQQGIALERPYQEALDQMK